MIGLFEHATEAVFEVDDEERFSYLNPRAELRFGRDEEELLGSVIWEEFPAARDSPLYEPVRAAREGGEETTFEGSVPPFEGLYEGFVKPSDDGVAVLARNLLHLPVETLRRLPTGVFRINVEDERLTGMNDALVSMLDADSRDELLEKRLQLYKDPDDRQELFEQLDSEGTLETSEIPMQTVAGNDIWVSFSAVRTEVPGESDHVEGIIQDVTERKKLMQKAERQAEELLEVSTPIVRIWDGILLATIIGTLDTERAERFTEELLSEISETGSEIALVDITGVPTIDTATAEHLADTINAVNLLGASVILTGIRPDIAQTMTQLGISLSGVETRQSLRDGLRSALNSRAELQFSDRRAGEDGGEDTGARGGERD